MNNPSKKTVIDHIGSAVFGVIMIFAFLQIDKYYFGSPQPEEHVSSLVSGVWRKDNGEALAISPGGYTMGSRNNFSGLSQTHGHELEILIFRSDDSSASCHYKYSASSTSIYLAIEKKTSSDLYCPDGIFMRIESFK